MKLMKPEDLTPEHLKALSNPRELTPEEKAEVMHLMETELSAQDFDRPEMWEPATPMEDLLREMEDDQQRWDKQHP